MVDKVKAEAEFVSDMVRRSMPSLTRPRLKTESEQKLAEIERKSAECYAGMETFTRRLTQLAKDIEDTDTGGIPAEFTGEEDSLVLSVDELHGAVEKR